MRGSVGKRALHGSQYVAIRGDDFWGTLQSQECGLEDCGKDGVGDANQHGTTGMADAGGNLSLIHI